MSDDHKPYDLSPELQSVVTAAAMTVVSPLNRGLSVKAKETQNDE
jgi:hypothetical protein